MKKKANESALVFCNNRQLCYDEKEIFLHNLGELLSQTKEQVVECRLKDYNTAQIVYQSGYIKDVNIDCDSYLAIIKDVVRKV